VYNGLLFIPSVLVAWTGDALDYKAPMGSSR
jgi:glutamine synthetase type III